MSEPNASANLALLADLKRQKRLSSDDLMTIRRVVFSDGLVSRDEAAALFDLNDALEDYDAGWPDLFAEVMVDYCVRQAEAHGYVSDEHSDWVIDRIMRDGVIQSATELELCVKILERSARVPVRLETFVLNELKRQVLEGTGPLRPSRELTPGVLGEAEVDIIRRVIYAAGGAGNVHVTQMEAEFLFDLNDATVEEENHPSWADLFVKALANHLMASFGRTALSRDEALRREAWLNDPKADVGNPLGNFAKGMKMLLTKEEPREDFEEKRRAEIAEAEKIEGHEARWLEDRIARDGVLHKNERALLEFVAEESPDVHRSLAPLLKKIA
ncbi:MAG: hypothetical protein AAGE89_02155 [Pseudomonadota bacterium]